jgi:hypothetical protein
MKTVLWGVAICSLADTDVSKQPAAFMTTLTMEMNEPTYRKYTASRHKDDSHRHIHRRRNFVLYV